MATNYQCKQWIQYLVINSSHKGRLDVSVQFEGVENEFVVDLHAEEGDGTEEGHEENQQP